MMIEVFKYTERVVNMVRPRKVLFMAIGKFFFYIYDLQFSQ
jgi:5'-3' exonuclease